MESAWVNLGVYLCIQGKQQPLKASSSMHHHLPLLLYWRAGGCKLSPQLALSSGNRKKRKKEEVHCAKIIEMDRCRTCCNNSPSVGGFSPQPIAPQMLPLLHQSG